MIMNIPYTFEGFSRWLGVDKDISLCLGSIQDEQTQQDRRRTGNPSCLPIHMKIGLPKSADIRLLSQTKASDASLQEENIPESLGRVHSVHIG